MNPNDFFNDPDLVALAKAAAAGKRSKVSDLAESGVDVNHVGKQGMTPLVWVLSTTQNHGGLESLLQAGADPNLKTAAFHSPMILAAGAKDSKYLKLFLENGGDPNATNNLGESALHLTVDQGRRQNMALLLDYKADINITDRTNSTPLYWAAVQRQLDDVIFLLERGADHTIAHDNGAPVAFVIQKFKYKPGVPHYQWREQIMEMLKARGVSFPVSRR